MLRKVIVAPRMDRHEAISLADSIAEWLRRKGLEASVERNLTPLVEKEARREDEPPPDLLITIGGDGTVLRAVHRFPETPPILAVRMGRVGFLADTEPQDALKTLDQILEGRYVRDECYMLSNNVGLPDALNEVRVGTMFPSQAADLELKIDGRVIARDLVDAVLVATNVGASAYTLSAGGSVVDPRLKAMVIVPVCPLSSNFKPYVVPSDTCISLRQLRRPPVTVMVDGQYQKQVQSGVEVEIRASQRSIIFLRTGLGFYDRLRRRLSMSSLSFAQ
ncbi:MAG: NAD(+)/NADH kinase [Candidatus Bathyarchaeia archaeon]